MSDHDSGEWSPTFITPDGAELDRSDWSKWRNGAQRSLENPDKTVRVKCRAATRKRLRDAKQGQESIDQVINRLLDRTNSKTKEERIDEMYAGRRATFRAESVELTGTIDSCDFVRPDGVAIVSLELDTPLEDGQEVFRTPLENLDVGGQEDV